MLAWLWLGAASSSRRGAASSIAMVDPLQGFRIYVKT